MRVKKENSQEICIRLVKYDKENFQNRKMFLDTENADISQLKIWKMRTSKKKKKTRMKTFWFSLLLPN